MRRLRLRSEGDVEDLPTLRSCVGPDAAAQNLYQVLGNRKPQAESAGLPRAGAIDLVETLENAAPVLRRDAGASIPDAEHHLPVSDFDVHVDRSAGWRELGGVVQQVAERLGQLGAVRDDFQVRRDGGVDRPLDAEAGNPLPDALRP